MYLTTLRIDGMACGACIMKVQAALENIHAEEIKIDQLSGETSFVTPGKPELRDIVQAVTGCGFRPSCIFTKEHDL